MSKITNREEQRDIIFAKLVFLDVLENILEALVFISISRGHFKEVWKSNHIKKCVNVDPFNINCSLEYSRN